MQAPAVPPSAADAVAMPRAPAVAPPNGKQIGFGLALIVLPGWLVFDWLPAHAPMSAVEAAAYVVDGARRFEDRTGHWMFGAGVYPWTYVVSILIGIGGVEQVVVGASPRRRPSAGPLKMLVAVLVGGIAVIAIAIGMSGHG